MRRYRGSTDAADAARPLAALIGRPNVGKSSLFNRLVGGRPALVEDMPGVTRDRRYGVVDWLGARFPQGAARAGTLGVRRDDAEAFCVWLSRRDTDARYRLPTAEELAERPAQAGAVVPFCAPGAPDFGSVPQRYALPRAAGSRSLPKILSGRIGTSGEDRHRCFRSVEMGAR